MDNVELEKVLTRLVQIGRVTAVNSANMQARVKFRNSGIVSGWLSVLQHTGAGVSVSPCEHKHDMEVTVSGTCSVDVTCEKEEEHNHSGTTVTSWMPSINEPVLVLYLPTDNSDGVILGGV